MADKKVCQDSKKIVIRKSVNWNEQFKELYDTKDCSDVVFEVGTSNVKKFHVHKLVLALASEAFEKWFFKASPEHVTTITLRNMEPEHFEILMRFIYRNECELESVNTAFAVAHAADRFSLHRLFTRCTHYIRNHMSIKNIWEAYDFALQYQIKWLMHFVKDTVTRCQNAVFNDPNFIHCDGRVFKSITREIGPDLNQRIFFIALASWAKAKIGVTDDGRISEVRQTLMPYFQYLRLLTLSPEVFAQVMSETNLLTDEEFTSIALNLVQVSDRPLPSWCNDSRVNKDNSPKTVLSNTFKS